MTRGAHPKTNRNHTFRNRNTGEPHVQIYSSPSPSFVDLWSVPHYISVALSVGAFGLQVTLSISVLYLQSACDEVLTLPLLPCLF